MHKCQKKLCFVIIVLHKIIHVCYIQCMTNEQITCIRFSTKTMICWCWWLFLHKHPLIHLWRSEIARWCRLMRLQNPVEDFVPGTKFYFDLMWFYFWVLIYFHNLCNLYLYNFMFRYKRYDWRSPNAERKLVTVPWHS